MEDDFDTHGPTLDQRFYDKLAIALADRVKQCGCRVPVVTGKLVCRCERGSTYLLSRLLWTSARIVTPASRERLY